MPGHLREPYFMVYFKDTRPIESTYKFILVFIKCTVYKLIQNVSNHNMSKDNVVLYLIHVCNPI